MNQLIKQIYKHHVWNSNPNKEFDHEEFALRVVKEILVMTYDQEVELLNAQKFAQASAMQDFRKYVKEQFEIK